MFDGAAFPQSLDEALFETWLEKGRASKIGYAYLLIVWDAYDSQYLPIYEENRDAILTFERYESATGRESLVAAYDLYSESRISS
jgi:hypothetical protein